MKEPLILAACMLTLGYAARADGIASLLLGPDTFLPCLTQAQVEATAHGDREAWPLYQLLNGDRCGFTVDLASGYVPNHPLYYFAIPDLLPKPLPEPPPAPVPLPASGWMIIAGLGMLGVRKWVNARYATAGIG